jgi:hypothetical protein
MRSRHGDYDLLDHRAYRPGHRPRCSTTVLCALRSDDTDARKATVARFGRSDRSAQQSVILNI